MARRRRRVGTGGGYRSPGGLALLNALASGYAADKYRPLAGPAGITLGSAMQGGLSVANAIRNAGILGGAAYDAGVGHRGAAGAGAVFHEAMGRGAEAAANEAAEQGYWQRTIAQQNIQQALERQRYLGALALAQAKAEAVGLKQRHADVQRGLITGKYRYSPSVQKEIETLENGTDHIRARTDLTDEQKDAAVAENERKLADTILRVRTVRPSDRPRAFIDYLLANGIASSDGKRHGLPVIRNGAITDVHWFNNDGTPVEKAEKNPDDALMKEARAAAAKHPDVVGSQPKMSFEAKTWQLYQSGKNLEKAREIGVSPDDLTQIRQELADFDEHPEKLANATPEEQRSVGQWRKVLDMPVRPVRPLSPADAEQMPGFGGGPAPAPPARPQPLSQEFLQAAPQMQAILRDAKENPAKYGDPTNQAVLQNALNWGETYNSHLEQQRQAGQQSQGAAPTPPAPQPPPQPQATFTPPQRGPAPLQPSEQIGQPTSKAEPQTDIERMYAQHDYESAVAMQRQFQAVAQDYGLEPLQPVAPEPAALSAGFGPSPFGGPVSPNPAIAEAYGEDIAGRIAGVQSIPMDPIARAQVIGAAIAEGQSRQRVDQVVGESERRRRRPIEENPLAYGFLPAYPTYPEEEDQYDYGYGGYYG